MARSFGDEHGHKEPEQQTTGGERRPDGAIQEAMTTVRLAREAMKMASENMVQAVSQYLLAEPGVNVFAILDGAAAPGLLTSLYRYQPDYICLYRGELQPDMEEVAPYMLRLEP